jgi:hypothetical protein
MPRAAPPDKAKPTNGLSFPVFKVQGSKFKVTLSAKNLELSGVRLAVSNACVILRPTGFYRFRI